ncbi:hypothetical protein CHS0354_005524, partial [Potamilus streckersoni]
MMFPVVGLSVGDRLFLLAASERHPLGVRGLGEKLKCGRAECLQGGEKSSRPMRNQEGTSVFFYSDTVRLGSIGNRPRK